MALKKLIDDESVWSVGEETEALHFLCKFRKVEEEREQLLSIANQNKYLRSLLMDNKLLLEDYTLVNSLPSHEGASMESNKSNAPITHVKRKRTESAVSSIIGILHGTNSEEAQAKALKQVLQRNSVKPIVQRVQFIDSESKDHGIISNMLASAKRFITMALDTQTPMVDQMTT